MQFTFNIVQMVLAVALIVTILLQSRGAGLGGVLGGDGNAYQTKRGFEKTLYISSIVIAVLFLGVALANFIF